MTTKTFINKWFKNSIHKEAFEIYLKLWGSEGLATYIWNSFSDRKDETLKSLKAMSIKELDQYMEALITLQG